MNDLTRRCPRCGRTVLWHRVYNTRAGVRAYCQDKKDHVRTLGGGARDVWGRLHRIVVGKQTRLF